MSRVIIVDDHPIVRKGLKEILTDSDGLFIIIDNFATFTIILIAI